MKDERELLATKVKEFRKEQNLNQFEFAEDCGLSKETVSLIEREKENVTIDTLRLLAAKMDITVSELFNCSPITYCIVPGKVELQGETHTTYGIGALKNNIMIECIHDITSDFNRLKNLVLLCNEECLSILHLKDVVDDFMD